VFIRAVIGQAELLRQYSCRIVDDLTIAVTIQDFFSQNQLKIIAMPVQIIIAEIPQMRM